MTNKTKIGRSAYIISEHGVERVRKYIPPVGGFLGRLSRKLFRTSLPFENERRVNLILLAEKFDHLLFPKLINLDCTDMLEFEYLHGEDVSNLSGEQLSRALDGLLEFNALGDRYKYEGVEGLIFRILESPAIRTVRNIAYSDIPLDNKMKGILLLIKYRLFQPRFMPVLIHNDLMFSNIRCSEKNNVIYLDFEDAHAEKGMILVDVVNVVFDKSNGDLDIYKIEEFWRKLSDVIGDEFTKLKLIDHIRICLLSLLIAGRNRSASTESERCIMDRLLIVVLDKTRYREWYFSQQAKYSEGGIRECATR